jgi:hypothetical protein
MLASDAAIAAGVRRVRKKPTPSSTAYSPEMDAPPGTSVSPIGRKTRWPLAVVILSDST